MTTAVSDHEFVCQLMDQAAARKPDDALTRGSFLTFHEVLDLFARMPADFVTTEGPRFNKALDLAMTGAVESKPGRLNAILQSAPMLRLRDEDPRTCAGFLPDLVTKLPLPAQKVEAITYVLGGDFAKTLAALHPKSYAIMVHNMVEELPFHAQSRIGNAAVVDNRIRRYTDEQVSPAAIDIASSLTREWSQTLEGHSLLTAFVPNPEFGLPPVLFLQVKKDVLTYKECFPVNADTARLLGTELTGLVAAELNALAETAQSPASRDILLVNASALKLG